MFTMLHAIINFQKIINSQIGTSDVTIYETEAGLTFPDFYFILFFSIVY